MSKDSHSFNISVACEVGVPGAIVMQHFLFLQKSNVSDTENWQQKWVRRSAKSIAKTYPYWSGKQVSGITDNLEKGEYIFSKIENASKIDRTKSYILTPKGLLLMGEIPFAQMENGFSKTGNANAQMENAIPEKGKCNIEEDCTSFIPSLEEEKDASLSSTSKPENQNLEAEEKENDLHRGAAGDYDFCACEHCGGAGFRYGRNGKETCPECDGSRTVVKPKQALVPPFTPTGEHIAPQPAKVVRLYENDLPGVTIVDSVPGTYETKQDPRTTPPAEIRRVNIPEEIESMRTDQTALEGFVIGRKLPRERFAEYLKEFEAEQVGLKTKYKDERELRLHFLNWSCIHHQVAQKKTAKHTGNNRSHINNAGGDLSKYSEKQIF